MRDKLVNIKVHEDERERWNQFAESQGMKLGTIIRELIEHEIASKQSTVSGADG